MEDYLKRTCLNGEINVNSKGLPTELGEFCKRLGFVVFQEMKRSIPGR